VGIRLIFKWRSTRRPQPFQEIQRNALDLGPFDPEISTVVACLLVASAGCHRLAVKPVVGGLLGDAIIVTPNFSCKTLFF